MPGRIDSASIFVYGSLAGPAAAVPGTRLATLTGWARGWGVAMDNRVDLPGYKYYTAGDRRPPVCVAFLDLREAEADGDGGSVLGVLRPVDPAELPALDARERNYIRTRVDAQVEVGDRFGAGDRITAGPVWAYVGTPAARARFAAGPTVIHAEYRREVLAGFARFGPEAHATVRRELSPGALPVCELVRHELPARSGPDLSV